MRKYAVAIGLVGAMLLSTAAHSAAYFIAGQWYYFSLNFEALLGGVTGKDVVKGTFVSAEIVITSSDVLCTNPQTHVLQPGKGPKGTAYGESENVGDADIVKEDRQKGKIFQTTTTVVDLVAVTDRLKLFEGPNALCKDAPGNSAWQPVYWRDKNCDKAKAPADLVPPICYDYQAFAMFVGETLTYITGPNAGSPVALHGEVCGRDSSLCPSWTFVYLPKVFTYKALLRTDTQQFSTQSGECRLPINNEPGAANPGAQYSILNPPVNGWAASLPNGLPAVFYVCT